MKIGIITFHCSYNYGSALQAYALQTYLKKQGHEPQIIDYILKNDFKQYKLLRFDRYLKNPKFIVSDVVFLPKTIKRKNSFISFKKNFLKLTSNTYYDDDDMSDLNNEFDCFICGSDQIWNTSCTGDIIPPFFLSFVNKNKLKVAYAPSIAQIHDNTSEEEKKLLKMLVNRLDFISVREQSTIPYITQITNKPVKSVLDPTLLLEPCDYNSLIQCSNVNVDRDYIFYYTLQKNDDMKNYCRILSEKKGLKIFYISKSNIHDFKNSKNVYGCSPADFLKFIKNAKYIVTNSFHATVFSILFERKFCVFGTKKSFIRMHDLLSALGIGDRIYLNEDFDIDNDIQYKLVCEQRNLLIESSKEYLSSSIIEV